MNPNLLTVANTEAWKPDGKQRKKPAARTEDARGLELSLAYQAARMNGFKLSLRCTDSKFTAELKM